MPYLIDGHNLIPKLPDLDLRTIDDENQLVELLLEYCRQKRKQVEVFFDRAPAGVPKIRNYGAVVARFVREGQTADDAIRIRLHRLGKQARNWTVVSSDKMVQSEARAAHAYYISSEVFAGELIQTLANIEPGKQKNTDAELSADEIDSWLAMFGADDGTNSGEET